MPFLSEEEWADIEPLLRPSLRALKDYRERTQESLADALEKNQGLPALVRFKEVTGYSETNVNAIWHHRRSLYGPKCPECGRLFRTSLAKFCAECGYRPEGAA